MLTYNSHFHPKLDKMHTLAFDMYIHNQMLCFFSLWKSVTLVVNLFVRWSGQLPFLLPCASAIALQYQGNHCPFNLLQKLTSHISLVPSPPCGPRNEAKVIYTCKMMPFEHVFANLWKLNISMIYLLVLVVLERHTHMFNVHDQQHCYHFW